LRKSDISVIIPTYKRVNFLVQAIDSVLDENGVDVDVLVIDDDPESAELGEVLSSRYQEKVRYHQNPQNLGPGDSRAYGLTHTSSNFVVFMDDDDFYTNPSAFQEALQVLQKHPDIAFVGFSTRNFKESNQRKTTVNSYSLLGVVDATSYLNKFGRDIAKPASTFSSVFRRSSLEKAGIGEVKMLNDNGIYLRALTAGNAYLSATVVGNYRIHDSNISKSLSEDFIIQNLDEKAAIQKRLPFVNVLERQIWLYRQTWMSIRYYIWNHPGEPYLKIRRWAGSQTGLTSLLLRLRIFQTIHKIRGENLP